MAGLFNSSNRFTALRIGPIESETEPVETSELPVPVFCSKIENLHFTNCNILHGVRSVHSGYGWLCLRYNLGKKASDVRPSILLIFDRQHFTEMFCSEIHVIQTQFGRM